MKELLICIAIALCSTVVGVAITNNVSPDQKEPVAIDSMYSCSFICLECKETGKKQVNILNKKGQIIAVYYDTILKEDIQLLNHSKIPGHE